MEILRPVDTKSQISVFLINMRFITNQVVERAHLLSNERPKASDAVLVSGSGRSGTTWIHDILGSIPGVQLIFEPLNPNFVEEASKLSGIPKSEQPKVFCQYLSADQNYPDWHTFLERILTGQVRNSWIDRSINWKHTNQYITKLIRGNLMLAYIKGNFDPKVIYVIRHPCAVILSRLNNGWFADVDDLLSQEALIDEYLKPWVGLIEKERDLIGAHAVWWAVENMVALHEIKKEEHYLIKYEDFCLSPRSLFSDLFSWLGYTRFEASKNLIQEPSRLSDISYATMKNRLGFWKDNLSTLTQERILVWADRLGIDMYSDDNLPKSNPLK